MKDQPKRDQVEASKLREVAEPGWLSAERSSVRQALRGLAKRYPQVARTLERPEPRRS